MFQRNWSRSRLDLCHLLKTKRDGVKKRRSLLSSCRGLWTTRSLKLISNPLKFQQSYLETLVQNLPKQQGRTNPQQPSSFCVWRLKTNERCLQPLDFPFLQPQSSILSCPHCNYRTWRLPAGSMVSCLLNNVFHVCRVPDSRPYLPKIA